MTDILQAIIADNAEIERLRAENAELGYGQRLRDDGGRVTRGP